jgi:hypothetical protein
MTHVEVGYNPVGAPQNPQVLDDILRIHLGVSSALAGIVQHGLDLIDQSLRTMLRDVDESVDTRGRQVRNSPWSARNSSRSWFEANIEFLVVS